MSQMNEVLLDNFFVFVCTKIFLKISPCDSTVAPVGVQCWLPEPRGVLYIWIQWVIETIWKVEGVLTCLTSAARDFLLPCQDLLCPRLRLLFTGGPLQNNDQWCEETEKTCWVFKRIALDRLNNIRLIVLKPKKITSIISLNQVSLLHAHLYQMTVCLMIIQISI